MNWQSVLKMKKTREMFFMELCLKQGFSVDAIKYTSEYPMGRPIGNYADSESTRFFYMSDEDEWERRENEEGRKKGPGNPYIAPNWKPERYADIQSAGNQILFIQGSKDIFKILEELWEKAMQMHALQN